MSGHLIILGCGYIGSRLARAALAQGRAVRVCARSTARLEPLQALGAEVRTFDAAKLRQVGPVLVGAVRPTIVYSVPPLPDVPAGVALARATEAALNAGASSFVYLSSAGLYGDKPDDAWIDESSNVAHDDPPMLSYFTDEAAVETASLAGLRTVTLRLAAVYGPGRGVRARLRAGDYKLLDEGRHYISRIHIDDVVRIVFTAEQKAPQGSLYVVGDDRPTTQREYAEWLSARLGLPVPASVASYAAGMRRTPHRGRRLRNDKLKRELGLTLLYPSYIEGEAQIEADEGGAPTTKEVAPAAAPTARPDFIRNLAAIAAESWSYPGSSEKHGAEQNLGDAVGLTRVGVALVRLPPGQRTSWPHAHSAEEELAYVLEGTPDLWVDGVLHRLAPGDVVGFPAGTGIAHVAINNTSTDVKLLVVGERRRGVDRVVYPVDPEYQARVAPDRAWSDAPKRPLGPHPGRPETPQR
jgi:uncharacterized cupin superfamily protein/nucleoside-diphosphate-sugar epimerase